MTMNNACSWYSAIKYPKNNPTTEDQQNKRLEFKQGFNLFGYLVILW